MVVVAGQSILLDRVRYLSASIAKLEEDDAERLRKNIVKLIEDALVPDILHDRQESVRRKVEVALSVLEVCFSLSIPPSKLLLDFIAHVELDQRLRHQRPTDVELFVKTHSPNIGEWLVAHCGKQIGQCPFFLFRCLGRQPMPFQSVAVTLDCLARYSSFDKQYQVVALDPFFAQGTWTTEQVVNCAPFLYIIPLGSKIRLAQQEFERRRLSNDKQSMFDQIYAGAEYTRDPIIGMSTRTYELKIRRDFAVEDSVAGVGGMTASKDIDGIKVKFVGEEGQDQGGLTKEWFLLMCDVLVPSVFLRSEDSAEYYDISAASPPSHAYLMGILLGLALQHQIVLDVSVAPHVHLALFEENHLPVLAGHAQLHHLHNPPIDLLRAIRPGLADGLAKLLTLDDPNTNIGVDFTFTQPKADGSTETETETETVEICSNGRQRQVTMGNRQEYVDTLCRFLLEQRPGLSRTLSAMRSGFSRVCSGIASLNLLTTAELNVLIRGQDSVPSVDALRSACIVVNGGKGSHAAYITQFWRIVEEMDKQDVRRLMHFVTASHRMPLVTHRHEARALVSPFTITLLDAFLTSVPSLPTASTCSNTLFLPVYPTEDVLRRCLLLAIREGSQGFGRP